MRVLPVDQRSFRPEPLITSVDTVIGGIVYSRPQGLDDYHLTLTLGGKTNFGSTTRKFAQTIGDLLLVEPHRALEQDIPEPWPRIWVMFAPRPHWHEWLNWPELAPGYRQIHVPDIRRGSPVLGALETMDRYASGTHWRGRELAMNALEAALIWCDAYNPLSKQAKLSPRVVRAMDFVSRHLGEPLSLDRIADDAGLSVPHLVRLFRREVDVSPMQFVERRRMQRAGELLTLTSRSVTDIAATVGFDDPFYFSTRFKRYSGKSPRAYRKTADDVSQTA